MNNRDIYTIADKYGHRQRTPDEEGMWFDKHAVLDFANALQTAAYAEGRKDERESLEPLTDDDIEAIAMHIRPIAETGQPTWEHAVARAIELAHGIKPA